MRAQLKWVVGLNTFEICVMNADGTNLVQLTDNVIACVRTRPWLTTRPTLTSTTSKASHFCEDEDSAGSQAREVELERSGA